MRGLAAILLLAAGCASVPERPDPAAEIWSAYADGVDGAEVSVAVVRDGVPAFAGNPRTLYRLGALTDFFVLEAARRIAARGEDVSGKTLEEIVRDEIVLPLQLRDTTFTPSADKMPRVAVRGEALGGLYSTAEDCVKFFASARRVRTPALLARRPLHWRNLEFAVDRAWGARRFLAYRRDGRDFVLIFRNVTDWKRPYRDFESASEALGE